MRILGHVFRSLAAVTFAAAAVFVGGATIDGEIHYLTGLGTLAFLGAATIDITIWDQRCK